MAVESIGSLVPTKIPGLSNQADIQAALRIYHYGSESFDTAETDPAELINPSIAYTINDIQDQIDAISGGSAIQATSFNAKGDLLSASANDTLAVLSVGSNGRVLTANSATATGLEWATLDLSTTLKQTDFSAKGDILSASANDTLSVLTVGANERRLVADSTETAGLKYVADTTNYAIAAKGDLLVGTAADTVAPLTVGTNGKTLVANSATATGLEWVTPASGSAWGYIGEVNSTSGVTVSFTGLGGLYKELLLTFNNVSISSNGTFTFRFNNDAGSTTYKIWNYRDFGGGTYNGESIATAIGCIGTMVTMDKSSGSLRITNAHSTGDKAVELNFKGKMADWVTATRVPDLTEALGGTYTGSAAISRIDMGIVNSNTFTSGTWKLWGMLA